jgi:hypothetical protein
MILQPTLFSSKRRKPFGPLTIYSLYSLIAVAMLLATHAEASETDKGQIELGRRIYMEGILPSGEPLKGSRLNTIQVEGTIAACENCHRRSGLGSMEGKIIVTPITGKYIFASDENRPLALVDTSSPRNVTKAHAPYTEASFSKALRDGIGINGKELNTLMPKYALNDTEIKAVIAYLKQLSVDLPQGVSKNTVRFATIITPGVDPKKSEVLVKMMQTIFTQRNASQEEYSGRMRMPLDLLPRTHREWELSVWELEGSPDSWREQLIDFYRKEPPFAIISGLTNTTWTPIHEFCQEVKLPCMLPSIPLPPNKKDFYSLYFSRGVALEADVLASLLRNPKTKVPHRLIQIYRDTEIGRGATQALTESLHDSKVKTENRLLRGNQAADIKEAFKGVRSNDAVMLWLDPSDISAIPKALPNQVPSVAYLSGILAEDHFNFNSKTWNSHVRVIYPYELGSKREKSVQMLRRWLQSWEVPFVDEMFQSEVFFNLLFLTDLSSQMIDNLYQDYFIERAEDMLSVGSKVSVYPHLSLGRDQRFASKGAYIAKLDSEGKLIQDSEWIIPDSK